MLSTIQAMNPHTKNLAFNYLTIKQKYSFGLKDSLGRLKLTLSGSLQLYHLQAGATFHNARTLEGERNIPSYKNGMYDIELWAKISLEY